MTFLFFRHDLGACFVSAPGDKLGLVFGDLVTFCGKKIVDVTKQDMYYVSYNCVT